MKFGNLEFIKLKRGVEDGRNLKIDNWLRWGVENGRKQVDEAPLDRSIKNNKVDQC